MYLNWPYRTIFVLFSVAMLVSIAVIERASAKPGENQEKPQSSEAEATSTDATDPSDNGKEMMPLRGKVTLVSFKVVATQVREIKTIPKEIYKNGAMRGMLHEFSFMTASDFDDWWDKTGWKKEEQPIIDFEQNVLVIKMHNAGDRNYRSWGCWIDEDGDLSLLCTMMTKAMWTPSDKNRLLFMTVPREGVKSIGDWFVKLRKYNVENSRNVEVTVAAQIVRKTISLPQPLDWGVSWDTRFAKQDELDQWWNKMGWDEKEKPAFDFSKSVMMVVTHDTNNKRFEKWGALIWKNGNASLNCVKYGEMNYTPGDQTTILFLKVPRWSEVK